MLTVEVDLNPKLQMDEKFTDCLTEQIEEIRGIRECLENSKSTLDTMKRKEEQGRMKRLVKSWEAEKEFYFMGEW
jgi:prefoldin subunit 5